MRLFKGWMAGILLGAVVWCCAPGTARAFDTNDVRTCYGIGEEVVYVDPAPYVQAIAEIDRKVQDMQVLVLYNKCVEQHLSLEEDTILVQLQSEVQSIQQRLANCIDLELSEIIALECQYNDKVAELNQFLYEQEGATIQPLDYVDDELSTLYADRDAAQFELDNLPPAVTFEDIGDKDYYPVIGKEYKVNSNYGTRWDPITKSSYTFHQGVDLRAPSGTQIGSWFHGVVESTGYSSGSGNYVWVNHGDDIRTFYCHLSQIKCIKGQQVKQGDVIALSGNTGTRTTGPHLHLGLYIDGKSRDPRKVLDS